MNASTRSSRHGKKTVTPSSTAKTPATNRPLPLRLARAIALGSLISCALALALSLVGAAVASTNADPDALLWPLALGILGLSALICGFVTRRTSHLPPLLSGVTAGLALVLLSFVLSYPFSGESTALSSTLAWALRGGIVALSLLGATMGATMPKKRRKRNKRVS